MCSCFSILFTHLKMYFIPLSRVYSLLLLLFYLLNKQENKKDFGMRFLYASKLFNSSLAFLCFNLTSIIIYIYWPVHTSSLCWVGPPFALRTALFLHERFLGDQHVTHVDMTALHLWLHIHDVTLLFHQIIKVLSLRSGDCGG